MVNLQHLAIVSIDVVDANESDNTAMQSGGC